MQATAQLTRGAASLQVKAAAPLLRSTRSVAPNHRYASHTEQQVVLNQSRAASRATQLCKATARPGVFLFGLGGGQEEEYYDESYTVMKFQVGIFGDIAKWQKDLERLSRLYDTDEGEGLHAILSDVLAMLLRNSEYVGYCTSGGRVFDSIEATEQKFNQVSFEERAKFKEETFTNMDGRSSRSLSSTAQDPSMKDLDQWMCITLLLAVDGEFKLPKISSVFDFKQAIKTMAAIREDDLVAFELMWTPQDEGDSYSKKELLTDYPAMVTLA